MELLILGLGNPGKKYLRTRHNLGFSVVDRIAEMEGIRLGKLIFRPWLYGRGRRAGNSIHLAKPLSYMNRSGDGVASLLRRTGLSPQELVVVCDTMDLPPGRLRLRKRGGSAGHGGLKSLISALGTQDFPRLYLGIGRPAAGLDVVSHVLGLPDKDEEELLLAAVDRAAQALLRLSREDPEAVMNEINGS